VTSRRLDELLVARGFYRTRSRARDAILRRTVTVGGEIARKPGMSVADDAKIVIADDARHYVSRGTLKLAHALDEFGIDPSGLHCLDIGASTGGFSQLLLERGAAHVTAIDVGHGQLAETLRNDPRITLIEGLNARDLAASHLEKPPGLIVCDVSFISLTLALPNALALAERGCWLVALIKPQFEAGRDALDDRGVVTDDAHRRLACDRVRGFLESAGWRVAGLTPSPIDGGDGNREFLIAAEKV
jgi:23S rRNA (cytidine1920-2'-O)/16S rRNA (cytidine1409-2'-O)-methyltransferase